MGTTATLASFKPIQLNTMTCLMWPSITEQQVRKTTHKWPPKCWSSASCTPEPHNTKFKIAPSIIHTHWMHTVQVAFGTDIIIINNHNHHVETIDPRKWTDPSLHQKQFCLYQKSTGCNDWHTSTYYVLHHILTNKTISKIKGTPSVQKLMKEYQCYVTHDRSPVGQDPMGYNTSQLCHRTQPIVLQLQPGCIKVQCSSPFQTTCKEDQDSHFLTSVHIPTSPTPPTHSLNKGLHSQSPPQWRFDPHASSKFFKHSCKPHSSLSHTLFATSILMGMKK